MSRQLCIIGLGCSTVDMPLLQEEIRLTSVHYVTTHVFPHSFDCTQAQRHAEYALPYHRHLSLATGGLSICRAATTTLLLCSYIGAALRAVTCLSRLVPRTLHFRCNTVPQTNYSYATPLLCLGRYSLAFNTYYPYQGETSPKWTPWPLTPRTIPRPTVLTTHALSTFRHRHIYLCLQHKPTVTTNCCSSPCHPFVRVTSHMISK